MHFRQNRTQFYRKPGKNSCNSPSGTIHNPDIMIFKLNRFADRLIIPDRFNFDKQFIYLDENSSNSAKTAGYHKNIGPVNADYRVFCRIPDK
jgi:hypothetical protein